jgi:hypothetical protein
MIILLLLLLLLLLIIIIILVIIKSLDYENVPGTIEYYIINLIKNPMTAIIIKYIRKIKNYVLYIKRQAQFNQNTCLCNSVIWILHSWRFCFCILLLYIFYCSLHNSLYYENIFMCYTWRWTHAVSKHVAWNKPWSFDVVCVAANSRALDGTNIVSRPEQE